MIPQRFRPDQRCRTTAHAAQRDRALPAHAPRPQGVLPGAPRAKNATRIGARERQHHEPPYTHRGHKNAARGKRRPRTSHTHYRHTTGALRRPAREKRTARAQLNLNATGQGPRTRHRLRLAGDAPFPLLTGGSAAPLSTATLLSTLEIGLGPSAARPPRRGAGRPAKHDLRRRGSKRRATGRPSTG